jgi:hypothetical protein
MLQELNCRIVGKAPLLMHNGQLADPLNKFVKALGEITVKKNKKTEADLAELARIEWTGSLYANAEGYLVIPSEVMESCIIAGAKKCRLGKQFASGVFVESDCVLDIGSKKKAVDLWGDDNFRDTRGVRVGQARVMRTRPIFRNWSFALVVSYDDEQVSLKDVHRALIDAGSKVGLCDFRPKFGRFDVEFM